MEYKSLFFKSDLLKSSLKSISFMSILCSVYLCLSACDGQSQDAPQNCEAPIEESCFMVRGGGGWVYQTLAGCDTVPVDAQLDKTGTCLMDQIAVHPCDSPEPPPGAPTCYVITPSLEQCPAGDCPLEYRFTDYCGVRGLDAEIYEQGLGQEGCHAPKTACEIIEGRTYYSRGLHGADTTPERVNKAHWRASFNKGVVTSLLYSDVVDTWPYQCDGTRVLVDYQDAQSTLAFNSDYSAFDGGSLGHNDVEYKYTVVKPGDGICSKIKGQRFSGKITRVNPEEGPVSVEFAEGKAMLAKYNPGGDIVNSGSYDCDLGEVHVHLNSNNDQPVRFELSADGKSLTQLEPNREVLTREVSPVVCNTVYKPVCAKIATNIQCVTEPCPNHRYETFANRCQSDERQAQFSFEGSCDKWKIKDFFSFDLEAVGLDVPDGTETQGVSVISASITDDILTTKLGYSGCNEQKVHFNVATTFLESNPVQAHNFFNTEREDACDAYFESTFSYDLTPLKSAFEQSYPDTPLEIIIRGVATYTENDKE